MMSIDQDKREQVDVYLNFFPADLKKYVEENTISIQKILKNIPVFNEIDNKQQLDIVILGVGAGYFEIPLLYWILKTYPNLSINITAIDKSERYKEIFLKAIEKIYNEKDENTFGRDEYKKLNENCKDSTNKINIFNSKNDKLKVEFKVTDFEKDYKINEDYDSSKQLFSKEYDIAICSFIFNHISFWRSLIIDIRNALKDKGSILISQIGGDSLCLNGDINKWKYESSVNKTSNKNKEELIDFFSQFYPINFSILSDNHEISATNISLARDFCEKVGFIDKSNFELELDSFSTSKKKLFNVIKTEVYSCFTENIKFHKEYNGKDIMKNITLDKNDTEFKFNAKVKWYIFNKEDNKDNYEIYSKGFGVTEKNIKQHSVLFDEQIQLLRYQRIPILEPIPENLDNLKNFMSYRLHLVSNIFRKYRILLDTVKVANLTFNNPFFDFDGSKFYNGSTLFFANNELSKNERQKVESYAKKYFKELQKAQIDNLIKANFTNLNFFYNNLSNIISSNFIIKFEINKNKLSILKLNLDDNISQIVLTYNPKNELEESNISKFIKNTIGTSKMNEYLQSINKSMEITSNIFHEGCVYFFPMIIHVAEEMEKQFINLTIITNKELQSNEIIFYNKIINKLGDITNYNNVIKFYHFKSRILKQQLKTAIISILVDSFAHNVSAHSLAALKWWFQQREKIYDKRIELSKKNETTNDYETFINNLAGFKPSKFDTKFLKTIAKKTDDYYKKLGLGDSNNNEHITSLMEIVQFMDSGLHYDNYSYKAFDSNDNEIENLNFHIPIPVDYAIWPFMRFLRDKAGFWSGVTRDLPFGGESINLFDIMWRDFASNPLFLGTIAHSEGIHKLNIKLQIEGFKKSILDFVHIDMSVIEYEENLLKKKVISIKSEENSNYSKYKFIRLGEDFETICEEIKKEKYNIFFPGGIVGEHAFFTILENSLRNVKHYKNCDDWNNIKKNGIDLVISIKPVRLLNNEIDKNKNKKQPELFNIEVWLNHKNTIYKTKKENGKEKIFDAYKTLIETTKLPIVNDEGKPKLGGNSQDKLCAAMLLNNTFESVESKIKTEIGRYYYNYKKKMYWIGFNIKDETTKKENNKVVKRIGKISKYFHLWRSEFIFVFRSLEDLQSENISRFKFVYIDSDNEKERDELEIKARDMGVIRIITKKDIEDKIIDKEKSGKLNNIILKNELNKYNIMLVYEIWLTKFFHDYFFKLSKVNKNPFFEYKTTNKVSNNCINIEIKHGSNKGDKHWEVLDYRSHGILLEKYFCDEEFKYFKPFVDNPNQQIQIEMMKNKHDFVEMILAKLCLFDDRIYERIPPEKIKYQIDSEKIYNLYSKKLNLMFKPESKKEWDDIKKNLKKDYNILVIHLSFIESFPGYTEKNINKFIKKELGIDKSDKVEKFILVITTGRGRFEWHEKLDPNYKRFTIFRPIESLLSAVEDAVSFKDDFQLKYNLVKVILGS